MRHLFLVLICLCFSSCTKHVYRPVLTGVVCDTETRLPIAGATIQFIKDTLTVYDTNVNMDERYKTDHNGVFKTIIFKDRYMRNHLLLFSLSWVFTVSSDDYITDTVDLRNMMPLDEPRHTLDTIWLKRAGIK